MRFVMPNRSRNTLGVMVAAFCIASAQTDAAAQAQSPPPSAKTAVPQTAVPDLTAEEAQTRLQSPVHLRLGCVSLPQLTDALSAQTGLRVDAADYLRARNLVVQLDGVSASAALNALAELNDWAWRDKGGGQILITRRLPVLRQEPETVPIRSRAALPKDIRAFCRIGAAYDPPPADPRADSPDASVPIIYRPKTLTDSLREKIVNGLKPDILSGSEILWTRLTPAQQQDMTAILLFDTLHLTISSLRGEPLPFVADPTRAFVEMQGNTLLIMSRPAPGRRAGFGTGISPRREEP